MTLVGRLGAALDTLDDALIDHEAHIRHHVALQVRRAGARVAMRVRDNICHVSTEGVDDELHELLAWWSDRLSQNDMWVCLDRRGVHFSDGMWGAQRRAICVRADRAGTPLDELEAEYDPISLAACRVEHHLERIGRQRAAELVAELLDSPQTMHPVSLSREPDGRWSIWVNINGDDALSHTLEHLRCDAASLGLPTCGPDRANISADGDVELYGPEGDDVRHLPAAPGAAAR